jgi:hypothetical protein
MNPGASIGISECASNDGLTSFGVVLERPGELDHDFIAMAVSHDPSGASCGLPNSTYARGMGVGAVHLDGAAGDRRDLKPSCRTRFIRTDGTGVRHCFPGQIASSPPQATSQDACRTRTVAVSSTTRAGCVYRP